MMIRLTAADSGEIRSRQPPPPRRLRGVVEHRLEDEVEAEEASGGDGEEHQSVKEAESHFHLRELRIGFWEMNEFLGVRSKFSDLSIRV